MFEDICFESERLITKQLSKEDVLSLFQIYSDGDAMKYRGSKPVRSIEDAYDMVANQLVASNSVLKRRLGIRDKSNNHLIGTLLLSWDENFDNHCEIGFSFGRDYWNKGYGKETLEMIERQLSIHTQIEIIKAWCIKENLASVRIFEKAKFLKIKQDEYTQSHLFSKRIKL